MKIVGYSDRWSVQPGEKVQFMVSTELSGYRADIVRLIHGDDTPGGPGFKDEPLETSVSGEYPGRQQPIRKGSYVTVPDSPTLRLANSSTLQAWIYPTTPGKGVQGIGLGERSGHLCDLSLGDTPDVHQRAVDHDQIAVQPAQ